ncbi:MAG: hypothetical protein HY075_05230, partial [Deltaproteobacteria bacterium]|nr:hypothetical protein [Deltaproteobacteria bacterium]
DRPQLDATFVPGAGPSFGRWPPLTVEVKGTRDAWVGTNVLAFPWTRFYVDGSPVPSQRLGIYPREFPRLATASLNKTHPAVAMLVAPGQHTLDARVEPEPALLWLRRLGFAALAAWIAAVAYFAAAPARCFSKKRSA